VEGGRRQSPVAAGVSDGLDGKVAEVQRRRKGTSKTQTAELTS